MYFETLLRDPASIRKLKVFYDLAALQCAIFKKKKIVYYLGLGV